MWTLLKNLPNQQVKDKTMNIVYWEIKGGKVFHQGRVHKNADVDSFEVYQNTTYSEPNHLVLLARDKTYVYFGFSKTKIDRVSFEIMGLNYYKDKEFVYFQRENSIKSLKNSNPKSLVCFGESYYAFDNNQAYYGGLVIKSCQNPTKLRLLGDFFATDDEHIYIGVSKINKANPKTWQDLGNGYSKDDKYVYRFNKRLANENPDDWDSNKAKSSPY